MNILENGKYNHKYKRTSLVCVARLRTLCVRRVALWAPGVTQSNLFGIFLLYINIVKKGNE